MKKAKVSVESLQSANWDHTIQEVNEKLKSLRAIVMSMKPGNPLAEAIANDLIYPALEHIARFCTRVELDSLATGTITSDNHKGKGKNDSTN